MRIGILAAAALLMLFQASSAIAEVTVTTDKPTYEVGEVVHITAHNAGPEDEDLVSEPPFTIWNQDAEQCVFGCLGLPVVTRFPAGQTISMDWDTGLHAYAPGNYLVQVVVNGVAPAGFVLTVGVPEEQDSWTTLKARYR